MVEEFLGRWDVTVKRGDSSFPAWFELASVSGELSGRYVGIWGSARPITGLEISGDTLRLEIPNQYEGVENNLVFTGSLADGVISGEHTCWADEAMTFIAVPAPNLENREVCDGSTFDLLGDGLEGFEARWNDKPLHWRVEGGELVNDAVGTDIVTKQQFRDFRLVAEYWYPRESNSGIYLRGRYEVQILDDFEHEPSLTSSAGIYGFIAPRINPIKPPGQWNRLEITLVGRHVSIKLNGQSVVDDEIPGITGGALDSNEENAGPILLQGDHGPVTFRKLELTELI